MDQKIDQLEAILAQMLDEHDQLDKLLVRKREALRQADHDLIIACSEQENHRVQAIAELEKKRAALVGELTLMLQPTAAEPMRLLELAQQLPEPARGRLLVRREALRKRMIEVRERSNVVQRAAQALAQHMHGLVQTIGTAMSGAGAYAAGGRLPAKATAISTFSMTA